MAGEVVMIHVIIPTCLTDSLMLGKCLVSQNDDGSWGRPSSHPQYTTHLIINTSEQVDLLLPEAKGNTLPLSVYVARKRLGFVDACNLGYRIADPADEDVVVVLNDDLVFSGPWLEVLVDALESGASQVGPSMKYVGRDARWGCGDERYRYLEGWCFATTGAVVGQAARQIESAEAANVCQRSPVLFDPAFSPAYCEDMDFSIRVLRSGGEVRQVDIPVEHLRSRTYGTDRPSWGVNREKLMKKWEL
jgi:glycosyltransferase involved in cell wall biosynthesis